MSTPNQKNDPNLEAVAGHLARLGFEFGVPEAWVMQKLRHVLGPERFREFDRTISEPDLVRRETAVPEFAQTFQEANLIRSHSTDVTLVTTHVLYQTIRARLTRGMHVLELGCYTAPLASYIAQQHPDCKVTAVDRVERLIALNRGYYRLPNLSFHAWDYSLRKPAKIGEADLLLCSLGMVNVNNGGYDLNPERAIREHEAYARQKDHALNYFRIWRTAVKDGADFYAILRIGTLGRLQAFFDAAVEAGWAPQFGACQQVFVKSANDMLALLVFRAEPAQPTSEEATNGLFIQLMSRRDQPHRLTGGMALEVYRSFRHRMILRERTMTTPRGIKTREEIGVAGSAGYVFLNDEQPDFTLVLLPVSEALRLQKLPPASHAPPNVSVISGQPQSTFCINVPAGQSSVTG